MITKERLEELIEQRKTIYYLNNLNNILPVTLNRTYIIDQEENYLVFEYSKDVTMLRELSKLYETKEEAKFVQKFHTSKTIYFEPPTWEEFLKTETNELKPNYTCENLIIVEDYNEIIVEDYNNDLNEKHFSYNKELNNRKQKYYEAVKYAKKLFLGEEEC